MPNGMVMQTQSLTKVYNTAGRKQKLALDRLTLDVHRGEIFGYLGPNGAGKTTTIRMLLGLINPTQGHSQVLGMDSLAERVAIHKRIGYLPGELNLWPNQTAKNVIRHFAELRGGVDWKYVDALAERLQFDYTLKIRQYSTGNKRKLGLVLALMNQPELLILDEPTSGLDPLMQQTFNEMMREWREAGRTVFLSSHVLSEVQAICDRVGILRNGELKTVSTIGEIMRRDFRKVKIVFRDTPRVAHLAQIDGVSDVHVDGLNVHLKMVGDVDPLLKALHDQYICDFDSEDPTLEDIFLTYYDDHHVNGQHEPMNAAVKERI